MAETEGVDLTGVAGSGAGGRVTKQDVAARLEPPPATLSPAPLPPSSPALPSGRPEERQRMSRRRRTIAQRLVEAQHTAAMLTTFNEVDMSAVMDMRKRRQEAFVAANGVKLGLTSFFVKASIGALRAFPRLNAEIQGDEIVLKGYYDIGIAVGAEEGLVVPVIRDADRLSFAAIERQVRDFGAKAKDNSFTLEELRGGTFTITNGGVFGSMLSTPILNPPQVGILGLHNIQDRPVVRDGQIVIRPMMYVALSYDHRIVDGREAVQFLVRVKQLVEEPETLLLEG
jgi:2-oxoglutarate dehydrogenase E2 component (dihydrolipoamide succinyltransferase)